MAPSTRREKLEQFVAQHPADAFARYGLAMECTNTGDHAAALQHFAALLAQHADYVPGYYHYGQLLLRLNRPDDARSILSQGVAAAQRKGDAHALEEMRAALESVGAASQT
jgi:thioredoxin-like negative regulator of GroEL